MDGQQLKNEIYKLRRHEIHSVFAPLGLQKETISLNSVISIIDKHSHKEHPVKEETDNDGYFGKKVIDEFVIEGEELTAVINKYRDLNYGVDVSVHYDPHYMGGWPVDKYTVRITKAVEVKKHD